MGEIIQFPELLPPTIDDYRPEPAVILILPNFSRRTAACMHAATIEHYLEMDRILAPDAEERVRRSFNALEEAISMAMLPAYDPGPAGWGDPVWPWPT